MQAHLASLEPATPVYQFAQTDELVARHCAIGHARTYFRMTRSIVTRSVVIQGVRPGSCCIVQAHAASLHAVAARPAWSAIRSTSSESLTSRHLPPQFARRRVASGTPRMANHVQVEILNLHSFVHDSLQLPTSSSKATLRSVDAACAL
jgi:hypothetical protein